MCDSARFLWYTKLFSFTHSLFSFFSLGFFHWDITVSIVARTRTLGLFSSLNHHRHTRICLFHIYPSSYVT